MTITNANFDSSRFVSKIKEAYQLRENLLNELHQLGISPSLICDCLTWESNKVEEMELKAKEVGILATENEDIHSLRELLTYGVKAMALLDKANTSTYGNPEITKVNISVGKNPGILISGHEALPNSPRNYERYRHINRRLRQIPLQQTSFR